MFVFVCVRACGRSHTIGRAFTHINTQKYQNAQILAHVSLYTKHTKQDTQQNTMTLTLHKKTRTTQTQSNKNTNKKS